MYGLYRDGPLWYLFLPSLTGPVSAGGDPLQWLCVAGAQLKSGCSADEAFLTAVTSRPLEY